MGYMRSEMISLDCRGWRHRRRCGMIVDWDLRVQPFSWGIRRIGRRTRSPSTRSETVFVSSIVEVVGNWEELNGFSI